MRITADIRRVAVTGRRPMIEGLFNKTKKYRMVLSRFEKPTRYNMDFIHFRLNIYLAAMKCQQNQVISP